MACIKAIMCKADGMMTIVHFSMISGTYCLHHQKMYVHHYYLCRPGVYCSFIHYLSGMLQHRISTSFTKQLYTFLFLALYCWLAILHGYRKTTGSEQQWIYFFESLPWILMPMIPVLFFNLKREKWNTEWPGKKYNIVWWIIFGVYCSLLMLVTGIASTKYFFPADLIIEAVLFTWLLELILVANSWGKKYIGKWKFFKAISLEKSILISIIIISLVLSCMAASSIGNPKYDSAEQLLIGFEFKPVQIIQHFDTFLSFFFQFIIVYACGYVYFIFNSKVLVPMILRRKGVILYILAGMAVVGISYPFLAFLLKSLPLNARLGHMFPENPLQLENAFAAILVLLLSLPVILAVQWAKQNNRIVTLEKEKAETELDLLKQQLNPHFFFNTLNNLYALSLQQSKQTPESILQLSELMRYVIYKAKDARVKIREEVKYIEDYIQLQQIRLKRRPEITFIQKIDNDTPPVAPLLLIVLVENAFKHGLEPAESNSALHLQLHTTSTRLFFSCINSFEQEAGQTGIGLENLQKRLQLLYPGKHLLKTEKENHIFKAELELDLS